MNDQIFIDLHGYEDLYSVSRSGSIKSKRNNSVLQPRSTNMKLYVRLYKDQKMVERNVDELVCEHWHKNYVKGEVVWHKDNDPHNCHIDNLLFKSKFKAKDYVVHYELDDGRIRMMNVISGAIATVNKLDTSAYNCFEVFNGYQPRDANNKLLPMTDAKLTEFADDFGKWVYQLKTNDIYTVNYTKFFCHLNNVKHVLEDLTAGLLDQFEPITSFEHNLFNHCYNGGQVYCQPGTYECFGYDFSSKYPTILRSKRLKIGLGTPKHRTLEVLPSIQDIKLGIYRVKITCSHKDFNKIFSFSKQHHYADESLKFALTHKKRFGVKITLIQDGKPNAFIYDKYVTGNKVFGNWFDTLIQLKEAFPQNKLVKHLLSSVWGCICHPRTINKTYEQIIKEGIKIDEEYEIIEHYQKGLDGTNEYYELSPINNMYKYNIRIKPFLTAIARNDIANVILDGDNIDYCIRVQTDSATFTKPIDYKAFDGLLPESKSTGKIKWNNVNRYQKI